jgi:hypothetical protein
LINEVIYQSEEALLRDNFPSERDLIEEILPYAKDNNNPRLRIQAIETLKTLGHRAP